jgi:hypothetical protein
MDRDLESAFSLTINRDISGIFQGLKAAVCGPTLKMVAPQKNRGHHHTRGFVTRAFTPETTPYHQRCSTWKMPHSQQDRQREWGYVLYNVLTRESPSRREYFDIRR